jgi:hypothetical protein
MPTNSSTSASERRFALVAALSFAVVIVALSVPYELLVRASEARYGVRRANVVSPLSASPKIDALVSDLAAGIHYSTYALGTSRTEEGFRSDELDRAAGLTYNLGMSGGSILAGFEVLDLLAERPALVLAGVMPMDFTMTGVRQGSVPIRLARDSIASLHRRPETVERGPAAKARAVTYALLHGASPARRRSLGQWLDLWQMHGDLLKFLNNADAVARQDDLWIRGFYGVRRVATPENFRQLRPGTIPAEYIKDHEPLYARLEEAVARQRGRGSEIVFVRLPIAPVARGLEDATGFDRDIRAASVRNGVRYIDGNELMGEAFINDRNNFVDGGHLNAGGATLFSRALANVLKDRSFKQ